jgi:outer membrane protein assembly factor BamC
VITSPTVPSVRRLAPLALAAALCGCSSIENFLAGDKIDYRSQASKAAKGLEVPPDLTQLARDNRYQAPGGVVSAAAAGAAPAGASTPVIAPDALANMRIERQGNQRWLVIGATPEQLWPQLRTFWQERGFNLAIDSPETGVMETDWAENRAKLPQDIFRSTIGRIFENLYSTGERDRFRTRVERVAGGSEVYISHRRMEEVITGQQRDSSIWQARPADPQLEAEFLSRLMVRLGSKEETARATVAAAPEAPPRARALTGTPAATLEVDESFDRAWRRVGLALDRSGFTVEDRDRASGIYYVRYIDPKEAEKGEPGFFSRLFGSSQAPTPVRYRISIKASGPKTNISVLTSSGAPEAGENGQRIVALLVGELK